MARIVKKPDIRKSEILNSAQRLFYQKGFENTTVNEIISSAGIAKGTFYHYFKAKDDLISEIIDRYITQIAEEINFVLDDSGLPPTQKLNFFFLKAGFFKPGNKFLSSILVRLIYLDLNRLIKDQMISTYSNTMTPLLAQILEEGNSKGNFYAGIPVYTAQFIITAYLNLLEDLAQAVLNKKLESHERLMLTEKSNTYSSAICKILGIEENSVSILDKELIDQYFQIFSSIQQSK